MSKNSGTRKNIYFRQDARSFAVDRQTQIYSYINRSIPYRLFVFSKQKFQNNLERLNRVFKRSDFKK